MKECLLKQHIQRSNVDVKNPVNLYVGQYVHVASGPLEGQRGRITQINVTRQLVYLHTDRLPVGADEPFVYFDELAPHERVVGEASVQQTNAS